MSDFDGIGEDGGDIGDVEGGLPAPVGTADAPPTALSEMRCLACDAPVVGVFCPHCGQKNDDLRRSSFLLARDFLHDTYSLDSRMWSTLGLLAVKPGRVAKDYAHGRRSLFTPPVRLFLVVSFLFFLTISLTHTYFMAMDVNYGDAAASGKTRSGAAVFINEPTDESCGFSARLKFFVNERALDIDTDRINRCFDKLKAAAREEIENPEKTDKIEIENSDDVELALSFTERIFGGVNWAMANPRAFNNSFNNWLPRVMLFMTPVLALLLTVFIRGKDAMVFDHLVLSLYTHAAAFAIVGFCLVLARFGVPYMGAAAFLGVAVYYLAVLKSAYGRGWIKTVWTMIASGLIYLIILFSAAFAIVINIVWNASA